MRNYIRIGVTCFLRKDYYDESREKFLINPNQECRKRASHESQVLLNGLYLDVFFLFVYTTCQMNNNEQNCEIQDQIFLSRLSKWENI